MPEDKGIGSKILGLFVESEDQPKPRDPAELARFGLKPKTPAEEVAELARASAAVPAAPEPLPLKLTPPSVPGTAPADFATVFKDAGMDPAELDRVAQAEALLSKLPATIGQAEKRAIVEASLKAFGFDIQKIATAAQNQKRALDAYVKVNETAASKANQEAEAKIKSLTEQIAQLRADVEKRGAGLTQLTARAQERKAQVQKVLEFFSAPETPTS